MDDKNNNYFQVYKFKNIHTLITYGYEVGP